MAQINVILWDVDGTLLDFSAAERRALEDCFRSFQMGPCTPELLARYHEIKKRITPPLARLINNQCSGCNMSLPSAVLSRVTSANGEIVECESCGRLLIP